MTEYRLNVSSKFAGVDPEVREKAASDLQRLFNRGYGNPSARGCEPVIPGPDEIAEMTSAEMYSDETGVLGLVCEVKGDMNPWQEDIITGLQQHELACR